MRKVAITGGLACGKTTVCTLLKDMGAYVISSDEIVHKLLSPETDIGKKVIDLLGFDIVVNHQIDRSRIAKRVFNDTHLLKSLEALLHGAVQEEIEAEFQRVKDDKNIKIFVAEVPLLYEARQEKYYDAVVAVIAEDKICRERFRSGEYEKRRDRQLKISEKEARADYIIYNQRSFEELKAEVEKVFKPLTSSS